jgi:hypothetical protein
MSVKTYVVAGTYHEARVWIVKNYQERLALGDKQVTTNDYFYVSKAEDLVGIQDPHGVFVGNWRGRPDILEMVLELMLRSTGNDALSKIYKELR